MTPAASIAPNRPSAEPRQRFDANRQRCRRAAFQHLDGLRRETVAGWREAVTVRAEACRGNVTATGAVARPGMADAWRRRKQREAIR